jgi:intracellular sulfur oxidation DsrE/DsrF family protein
MHRRSLFMGALAATGTMLATALNQKRAKAASPEKSKVAYHLCDLDKVSFVIGNIRNHLDGMGGADNVKIALVVHGPALKAFHSANANPDLSQIVGQFSKSGLELSACGNTMKAQNVTLKELLPGFIVAEKGGVVRLAELQSEGYAYLRP